MADKTYEIEVKTTADTDGVVSVKDALKETQDEANATREALEEAFQSATEEVERLEDALMEAELNGDDIEADIIADELAEARTKAEELEEELNNLDSTTLDNTIGGFEELQEKIQETTETTEGLNANLELLDSAIMMDMAGSISEMGGSAESMAQGVESASISIGQLSTQTGVAESQMVGLINHISNVTFPREEAMAYVGALNQMGVSADKLGTSATNMDKINDATHIGYSNVISLTQGLRSMGVEANNLPSAFNALAYTQSNVTGGAESLNRVLKTQASTLNEYGLNVDQTAVLLGKLSANGIQYRQLGSELSNVLKENNGDLRAVEQSLGLQAGTLDNASAVTGEYEGQLQALADEEMEHKTILERINAVWEDMELSMSPLISIGGSVAGVFGQIGSTALQINSLVTLGKTLRDWDRLSGVFSRVNGGLTTLRGGFARIVTASKEALIGVSNFAKTLLSTVVSAVKTAVTSFLDLAKSVLLAGYNALKSAGMWLIEKAQVLASAIANGIAEASQWALNLAMSMNPIMLVVIAIGLLIGALAYLYFNNEQVKGAIDGLGQSLWAVGEIIYGFLQQAWDTLITTLQNVWNYITTLGGLLPANVSITGNQIVDTILRVLMFIGTLPLQLAMIFANIIAKALGFGDNFVQNLIRAGSQSVSNFISYISQIPGKLANELNNALNKVNEWASTLPQKFWDAGVNAVKQFLSALGIASPGTMQRMLVWEITEMGNRVPLESRKLLSNISDLGTNIVDEFGNPRLSVETSSVMNGSITSENGNSPTQVNNFYFTDTVVDNEERMEEICNYITRKISWNNTTSGRTI